MIKDYNTGRKPLRLKEYGRNVQKLVDYVRQIEDKDERTRNAKTLITLMRQIVPGSKDTQETPQKFWDDLFIISDFDLDVNSPYAIPEREILDKKPHPMKYHTYDVKYKHYGHNIELLINEAMKKENEEDRQKAIIYIGKLMKTFHMTWSNEIIDDETILEIIANLSDNKLKLDVDKETIKENSLFETLYKEKSKGKPRRNQGKGNQNRRRRN